LVINELNGQKCKGLDDFVRPGGKLGSHSPRDTPLLTMDMPMTPPRPLTPFEGQDVRTLIDAQAHRRGDHPCLIWEPFEGEGRTWTYAEFDALVTRLAAGLVPAAAAAAAADAGADAAAAPAVLLMT
jgi:hypothetical protein